MRKTIYHTDQVIGLCVLFLLVLIGSCGGNAKCLVVSNVDGTAVEGAYFAYRVFGIPNYDPLQSALGYNSEVKSKASVASGSICFSSDFMKNAVTETDGAWYLVANGESIYLGNGLARQMVLGEKNQYQIRIKWLDN